MKASRQPAKQPKRVMKKAFTLIPPTVTIDISLKPKTASVDLPQTEKKQAPMVRKKCTVVLKLGSVDDAE